MLLSYRTVDMCLLGFVGGVLDEANVLAGHRAGSATDATPSISKDDVLLALKSTTEFLFAPPPPREVVTD